MLGFIPMLGFSLLMMTYGFLAVFKQDYLWRIRHFSAKLEGKGGVKRDEAGVESLNRSTKIMGVLALILGALGFFLSLAVMYIYFQTQAGYIDI